MAELIIDDNYNPPELFDGTFGATGLVPRDMQSFPMGAFAPVAQLQLIPQGEWSDRIRAKEANRSRLSDLRLTANAGKRIPSLNQGSYGYCWAHGPVQAAHVIRAKMNQEYVPLSAFSVAATLKKGKNEGAWGAYALDQMKQWIAPQSLWPQGDANYRKYTADPAVIEAGKKFAVTGTFEELEAAVYDRDMTFAQVASCLLQNIPVVGDFNWWGHCVVLLDLVETSAGKYGVRIWNSWGDSWEPENYGMAVLSGSKAIPDNAVALSGVLAS